MPHKVCQFLMSPNSARKSIADIFVHPIQVGNTAMESILTMVGYMYTAVPSCLRQSSKTDTICCKFVIFTLMNRNLTNCIMETWKIITNVVIVDYIKHKNDESISAENLKQLRKSHFIFAMLVAIGLLYSHICRFFI